MSKASDAANAVMFAVEQVLDLFGVQHTREQSRVVNVADNRRPSGFRPMYFGKWIDDFGNAHSSGRADILARPKILLTAPPLLISVPLWIECKAGKGRLSPDQEAFRDWVKGNGDEYLLLRDDVTPLIQWLERHGVVKSPKTILVENAVTTAKLNELECKWCGKPKAQHLNKIAACPTREALGKVWTPKLRK